MLYRLRRYADLAYLIGLLCLLVVVTFFGESFDKLRPLVGLTRRYPYRGWGETCLHD